MRRLATLVFLATLCTSRAPGAPPGQDDALLRAEGLLEKKDYRKAEAALREIVAAAPGNPRAHGDLALALLSLGRTREAVDEARLAAAFGPEAPEARYIYGLTLTAAGRPLEAARELEKAVALKPGPMAPLRVLAEAYAQTGDERAAETYARLIALEPDVRADRAALAEFLWASERPDRGNRVLDEALVKFPGDSGLLIRYGRALIAQGRTVAGAEKLETARASGAGSEALMLLLGDAYRQAGRSEEALEVFEAAAREYPGSANSRAELGRSLALSGAHERALSELEAASRLDPRSVEIQLDYGRALETLGRLEEAEAAYRRAVQASPGLPRGHYALGRLLLRQGRKAEGDAELAIHRSLYERALKTVSEAESRSKELAMARSELHRGRAEAALARFTSLPESADSLLGRAESLSRLNRHAEAVRVLERARVLAPEDRRIERLLLAERTRTDGVAP